MNKFDLYRTALQHKGMMEVRCCCRPEKLLGWLPSPPMGAPSATFPIRPKGQASGFDQLILKTQTFGGLNPDLWRTCYKAEDVSIETLRKINTFKENRDDER